MIAEHFLGIPYTPLGTTRSGVDCYGLIVLFYRELFDIQLDIQVGHLPSLLTREPVVTPSNVWNPVETPAYGDVVALGTARVEHVGIYVAEDSILHALKGAFSCVWPLRKIRVHGWTHFGYYRHDHNLRVS